MSKPKETKKIETGEELIARVGDELSENKSLSMLEKVMVMVILDTVGKFYPGPTVTREVSRQLNQIADNFEARGLRSNADGTLAESDPNAAIHASR